LLKAADGTGKTERLCSMRDYIGACAWSGDGKSIIAEQMTPGGFVDVVSLAIEGNRAVKPLLQEKWAEFQPQISKDGRWMAYGSDESGQEEIYVRPFPM